MAEANNKTKETNKSVDAFLAGVENQQKREDAKKIKDIITHITNEQPKMWGPSIVGYGSYHYEYNSGREGESLRIGFSPRKANLTIYFMDGFDKYHDQLKQLGKHKTSVSCLYIKKLEDFELTILKAMLKKSFKSTAMGEPKATGDMN